MSPRAGVYIYLGSITMRLNILAKKIHPSGQPRGSNEFKGLSFGRQKPMNCVLMQLCPDTFLVLCPQQQRDDALTSYMQLLARSIPASILLPSYLPTYTFLPSLRTRQLIVRTSYGRLGWQFGRFWPSKRLSNLRFSCSTTTSSSTTTKTGSSSQPIFELSKFSIILYNFFSRQKDNKLWKLREESFTNASIVIKRLFTKSFKSITNSAR